MLNTIIGVLFILITILIITKEVIKENKEEKESLEHFKAWLAEEKNKPKCIIKFMLKGNNHLVHKTEAFEPYYWLYMSQGIKYSSRKLAEEHIALSYKKGFFIDKDKVAHSISNITKAWVYEEDL